jgi:CIC family chloride channel protein
LRRDSTRLWSPWEGIGNGWARTSRQRRLLLDSLLLGVVGAFSAQLFTLLLHGAQRVLLVGIGGYQLPGLPAEGGKLTPALGEHGLWLIPVVTTLGGLLSGLLVFTFAPEAEGHGTDAVVSAFHHAAGKLRLRVVPLKMIASAITIGSGGSAGREGPTALISAGIGSAYGKIGTRTEHERRMLLLIGAAAGLSAIFRSPIGSALFAVEVLYGDMEFEAAGLLYAMLASIVAFAVNGFFVGYTPLFDIPAAIGAGGVVDHLYYAPLGIVAGLIGTALPFAFYGARDLFRKLPVPPHVKPAIGGLATGLLALVLPQVLGGGYASIQDAIDGQLATWLLCALIFAKLVAFCLTVSSGGSGGVFAPSLFVGAMLGAFAARIFNQPAAAFTVVGMAAVFGAAARVPIATLFMVTEMTGGYQLLVPAALAVSIAFLTQGVLSSPLKHRSLYEAQVPERAYSPAHQAEHLRLALEQLRRRNGPLPETFQHIDLIELLQSGVPVDLIDGTRLHVELASASSPFLGQGSTDWNGHSGRILALIREGRVIALTVSARVQVGDQLLLISPVHLPIPSPAPNVVVGPVA